jgi:hypothetical protein
MRDLRIDDGDGWVAGQWGPSYKIFFAIYFWFLSADPENLSAGGRLIRPRALGPYAGRRTPASTDTTKNLVIHDDIHITFLDFVIEHTASMTTVRFRHRFTVLDMKPDMKSKHHDVVPISS